MTGIKTWQHNHTVTHACVLQSEWSTVGRASTMLLDNNFVSGVKCQQMTALYTYVNMSRSQHQSRTLTAVELAQLFNAKTGCGTAVAEQCARVLFEAVQGTDGRAAFHPTSYFDIQTSKYCAGRCAQCAAYIDGDAVVEENKYGIGSGTAEDNAWDSVLTLKRSFCSGACLELSEA